MEEMYINVYNTHIEIFPYKRGDVPQLEKMMSVYNKSSRHYEPMTYFIEDSVLYLPRGVSTFVLEKYFDVIPTVITHYDKYSHIKEEYKPLLPPKSTMQENGIKFLCGDGDYSYSRRYSQLGLNLDTGDGKSYATVYSLLKLGLKSIIITHQEKIKLQWYDTFISKTDLPESRIFNISGSDVIEQINSYARDNGWESIHDLFIKLQVGIKVYDEAHKFFENIFMVDCFSNTYKTFYLTATFGRSDVFEYAVYKRAFSSLARFGEETLNYEEKRKHINFIVCYFMSKPEYGITPKVRNVHGFSSYKYIDYELKINQHDALIKVLRTILDKISNLEGKVLILSPKKESVKIIAREVYEYTGEKVGLVYSDNSDKENEESKQCRFISSTIKSCGTGFDIPGLRVLINLEPVASKDLADQVRGRLREYSPEAETYLFYPVDLSIPDMEPMCNRIIPTMKKKCKSVNFIKL